MRIQVKQLRRHAAAHSFYHLDQSAISGCACAGLACFAARADRPRVWQRAIDQQPTVSCLGKCYDGPSDSAHDIRPNTNSHARRTVLLGNVLIGGVTGIVTLDDIVEYLAMLLDGIVEVGKLQQIEGQRFRA